MRYFFEIAYDGSDFVGWQNQPGQSSIQGALEIVLTNYFREPISIVGCGRTDAGVHARQYFFHTDISREVTAEDLFPLNKMLNKAIAIKTVYPVHEEAHARFDANQRSYIYLISTTKNPMYHPFTWYIHYWPRIDKNAIRESARLLLQYKGFTPFCKAHSGVNNTKCTLSKCEWNINDNEELVTFHVSANRFLRGMVRLMVGAMLNVGLGKLSMDELQKSMDQQVLLPQPWSVPANGLYLNHVSYPFTLKDFNS